MHACMPASIVSSQLRVFLSIVACEDTQPPFCKRGVCKDGTRCVETQDGDGCQCLVESSDLRT